VQGVMLTHANLLAAIIALRTFVSSYEVEMDDKDVFLSFLPLAHIFDRLVQLAANSLLRSWLPSLLRLPACASCLCLADPACLAATA
jgi:long-subunit acyl-CoA synthetase (AMP-forming)